MGMNGVLTDLIWTEWETLVDKNKPQRNDVDEFDLEEKYDI